MAKQEFDVIDAVPYSAFSISALQGAGIASFNLPGGIDLKSTLFTLQGLSVDIGFILGVVSLIAILFTNGYDFKSPSNMRNGRAKGNTMSDTTYGLFIGGLGTFTAVELFPPVTDIVMSDPAIGLVIAGVQGAMAFALAYED